MITIKGVVNTFGLLPTRILAKRYFTNQHERNELWYIVYYKYFMSLFYIYLEQRVANAYMRCKML